MKNSYEFLELKIIYLDIHDFIRTSSSQDFKDYEENELPLVPFVKGW